jgi:hypothetical protein
MKVDFSVEITILASTDIRKIYLLFGRCFKKR